MRNLILLISFIYIPLIVFAQDLSVKGKVINNTKESLLLVNVVALQTDSSFVTGCTTDEQGQYQLTLMNEGKYLIKFQSIGYESVYMPVEVNQPLQMGTTILNTKNYQLKEVQVTSKTPLIKREVDRIVFDPKNIAGATNSVDLLRVAPAVIIDNDNISMFGTQGVRFYINGKEQKISANEMIQVLKSYSAEDVDKIEIITDPGVKYAANGAYGIINLKLKKKENNYLGGSLSYEHIQYKGHAGTPNGSLLYNKGKWLTSINAGGNWKRSPYVETNTTYLTNSKKISDDDGLIGDNGGFVKAQVDYQLNNKIALGAYALYKKGNRTLNTDNHSFQYFAISDDDTRTTSLLERKEKTDNYVANINAEQKIGGKGATIWYNFDYYHVLSDDNTNSETKTFPLKSQTFSDRIAFENIISQSVNNYTGKIDATIPFGQNRINVGGQYAFTNNSRDYNYYTPQLQDRQYDQFDYSEQVGALYAEYQRKLSAVWSFNVGARMEATWTKGNNKTIAEIRKHSDIRLFPNFKIGYRLGESHTFTLNLSNWVTRPNMYHVNPNVIQRDKYSRTIGNPDLQSSYVYKGMLSYSYGYNLMMDAYYAYQPHNFSGVTSVDENMVRTTRWENCLDTRMMGINMFYYYDKIKWMTLTLSHGVCWQKDVSSSQYTQPSCERVNYVAMINAQVFFDAKRRFIGSVSGNFTSKDKTVQTEMNAMYKLHASMQYNCLNSKLNITLGCDNLLASRIKGKEYSDGAVMKFNNKFQYVQPKIAVAYRFGARLRSKHHLLESDKMKERMINDF